MTYQDLVQQAEEIKARIKQISSDELENIKKDQDLVILDVREDFEYKAGYILNAYNLSLKDIEQKIELVIPNKSTKIVSYCRSGNRSAIATHTLNNLGYFNVASLQGGITAWTNSGKEIISD